MKKGKRALPCLLAACLAFGLCACGGGTNEISLGNNSRTQTIDFCFDESAGNLTASADNKEKLTGFDKVGESGILVLYVNRETSCVAVEDKRSGKLWSTIPLDLDTDTVATEDMKNMMRSVLKVEYYRNSQRNTMYSYADCIQEDKFTTEDIENGVRLIFDIGKTEVTFDDLPSKLSDERFQQFFVNNENLTETDKKRVDKYFEFNEEENVWEMTSTSTTTLRALYEIMGRVGYTEEELKYDCEQNGVAYQGGNKEFFNVAVDYTLQNDSLMVEVPLDELEYNTSYPPTTISVNELLMQDRGNTAGSLFIPDGSGALVSFSKDQLDTGSYTIDLYGSECSISNLNEEVKSILNLMPVYGVDAGNSGILAIIEDGDTFARITATKAGTLNSYNFVSASYTVSASTLSAVGDGSAGSQLPVTQKEIYKGSLRTRYVILDEEASYSRMAACYKKYLMQRDGLELKGVSQTPEFQLELIGSVAKTKSFLGFQYEGIQKLTTFDQAAEILKLYEEAGVDHIQLQFSGALKGGLDNYSVKKTKFLSELGGAKGYKKLAQTLTDMGGHLYLANALMSVPQDSGDFNRYTESAKTIDQSMAKVFSYNLVTLEKEKLSAIVSPGYLPSYMDAYLASAGKKGVENLAFVDVGSKVYADYNNNLVINRQTAKRNALTALEKAAGKTENLMLTSAYMDSVRYANSLVEMPLYSNQQALISRTVPFMEIVLSGIVPYSGEAYNEVDDQAYLRLKMVETGAVPYFSLFYADNTLLRNTDYTYLTSNNYTLWFDESVELYKEYQTLYESIAGSHITGHEQLQTDVFKTVYANGVSVIVNYSSKDVQADGKTVPSMDYIVGKEG